MFTALAIVMFCVSVDLPIARPDKLLLNVQPLVEKADVKLLLYD